MVNIIPQPVEVQENVGFFLLDSDTQILYHSEFKNIVDYLLTMLRISSGYNLESEIYQKEESNSIMLIHDSRTDRMQKEGYALEVSSENIIIRSKSSNGIFYGIQSLRQLFPREIETKEKSVGIDWKVECLSVEDYPRFAWRGFMFDEGRHFHGIKVVKRLLDLLALYKMNKFHWHLTDDQGWRIEIKKYPKLVEIGSKRKRTQTGGIRSFLTRQKSNKTHEGYYTQDEIIEIVDYAKNLFIDVIPEIDIPGHSMAAIASYPEYSCTGGPFEVATTWGIKKDVLCPGKERTFEFVQNILLEIMELFPYPVLHIGGDEVPKSRWTKCLDCQTKKKELKIADEDQLQNYFIDRVTNFLVKNRRIPMGWNEVLHDDLLPEMIVQHWLKGDEQVEQHLRSGRKFVISRFFYYYLDYDYLMTPLSKTYNFEPIPPTLESEFHGNILGIEAPLWTEWVPNQRRIDWQTFPRLIAVSETAWSQIYNKNYLSFKKRLDFHLKRLDLLDVKFANRKEFDPGFIRRIFLPLKLLKDPNSQ
ncbi:MAG: beta-N-acetylhexosaminidase [Candidatus Hodarchaeales archaeon]